MTLLHDQVTGTCVLYRPIFGESVVKFKRELIVFATFRSFVERQGRLIQQMSRLVKLGEVCVRSF